MAFIHIHWAFALTTDYAIGMLNIKQSGQDQMGLFNLWFYVRYQHRTSVNPTYCQVVELNTQPEHCESSSYTKGQ